MGTILVCGVLMILRQFIRKLMIAALVGSLNVAVARAKSVSVESTKISESDRKFQRDLESLLGASLKTKQGEMSLRQSKDRFGRIRKQILVGRDFSEVQLDQNGDGTVDYWSVSQGRKSIVASQPSRGRFLRLVVSDNVAKGLIESTYILSLDGKKYNLLKTRFVGSGVRYAYDSEATPRGAASFGVKAAADAESNRIQEILDTGASAASSIDAKPIARTDDNRFALVEGDWVQQQTTVFGDELTCASPSNGNGRLAGLQREWWKVLKFEVDEKADRLTEKLKSSAMFADSCKTPENAVAFDRMAKQLSQVMLSSAKGDAWTSESSRGRYLRCLENSGLGITAAEMERGFLDSMTATNRSYAPVSCEIKPGSEGKAKPGETNPGRKQVIVHLAPGDEGMVDRDGTTVNYANILFHEMIHVSGITEADETMVHAATACCGDPSAARNVGCNQLDLLLAKRNRRTEIETVLSRVSGELTPLRADLEGTFGVVDANNIYQAFIEGLDGYKKGSPPQGTYPDGLISSEEISRCMASASAQSCKTKWTNEIRSYADTFFSKKCRGLASPTSRKNCSKVSADFKNSLSATMATALIRVPSPETPSTPGACHGVARTPSAPDSFSASIWQLFESVFAGTAKAQEDVDPCGGPQIGVPPVATTPPVLCSTPECSPSSAVSQDMSTGVNVPWSVPGESSSGSASQTEDRQTGSGSGRRSSAGGRNGGGRTSSPVPVQRVDSVTDGQIFADDHYRRATDLVGTATRQIEKVRDSILPRAEASAGDRSSGSTRLDLSEKFIPFQPSESKSLSSAIDNPFSEKRSIASIADISNSVAGKSGASGGSVGGASSGGPVGSTGGDGAGATSVNSKGSAAAVRGAERKGSGPDGLTGSSSPASNSVRSSASMTNGGSKSSSRADKDLLDGLFKQPYREIETRLNRIEVAEALIDAKISVQDAKGRLFGSRKAKERYVFAGFDKPLQRTKD
ncbi:hypothetical protein BH10BDE1_BH10BDE1_31250 [soil metagenome]